jgi:uroporphyrinogen decarboxylase
MMWTGRQTVDGAMRRKPVGYVPVSDNPWGDTLRKWIAQGYPKDEKDKPVNPVDHFHFDIGGMAGFDWIAQTGVREVLDETAEWKVVRDGNGAAFKWWKDKSGTPEHVAFLMTSREVWERDYKPHLVGSARRRLPPEKIEQAKKDLDRNRQKGRSVRSGLRGLWENMRGAFGDECLYENMILDPAWIRDYCRTYTDLYQEASTLLYDQAGKPDAVWFYDDFGYKFTTFCAPALYGELIFPFYHELVAFCHRMDLPVVLHTCGYTESIMDLVVEAGFDGVNPMEVKAGNDPLRMARKWGDRIGFVGGLDARVLESHDRALIRKEVGALIEGMKGCGAGFVFGSDHSLSTLIDYQDFLYALEVYREKRNY